MHQIFAIETGKSLLHVSYTIANAYSEPVNLVKYTLNQKTKQFYNCFG